MRAFCVFLALFGSFTSALAADATCAKASESYGSLMRASLYCNFPTDRAIDHSISAMQQSCSSTPSDDLHPAIRSGFRIFDEDLGRLGKEQACKQWGAFIRTLSH